MTGSRIPAWTGPLDVEGLGMDAAADAADAVRALAGSRGAIVRVEAVSTLVEGSFAAIEQLRVDGRAAEPWAPLSGFAPAADGWVRLHGNYPHHAAALRAALDLDGAADERAALAEACAALPAETVCARVQERGGIAAVVRAEVEWTRHAQALATRDDPWLAVEPGPPRPTLPPVRDARRPLDGVRVLDLTRVVAGPMGTQLLGCLGADVLRLDPPHLPEQLDAFLAAGMGKRSAVIDLRGRSRSLESLVAGADVVVLGYRPGSLDRHGLQPEMLRARHPHLVVATLSAWGEHGPWGAREGFDSIVQAATGIAAVYSGDDARPGALPVQALDHSTGLRLAAGILDLLASGRGGRVRGSLLGAARDLLARPRGAATGAAGTAGEPPAREPGPGGPGAGVAPSVLMLPTPHGRVRTVPPRCCSTAPRSTRRSAATGRPSRDGCRGSEAQAPNARARVMTARAAVRVGPR